MSRNVAENEISVSFSPDIREYQLSNRGYEEDE